MTVHEPEPEITCRELVELVTDYQDGALESDAVDLVEEHLVLCDWCRDYLAQLEATVAATARIVDDPPPTEVLETVIAAFRARHGRTA
jgi:predicted anti-sigma-YlaC factor YlaD